MVACRRISPVLYVFPEARLTILTHYPPRAPILPGVSVTAFTGSHAGRGALQPIQAFWEALGMSMSISKPGNTSSQRSCTVLPSPQSKGGCVSCPPYTICCLFMVLSKVSRTLLHVCSVHPSPSGTASSPLKSVPFAPALGQGCLVFPSQQGGCSTDSRAGFQQQQRA